MSSTTHIREKSFLYKLMPNHRSEKRENQVLSNKEFKRELAWIMIDSFLSYSNKQTKIFNFLLRMTRYPFYEVVSPRQSYIANNKHVKASLRTVNRVTTMLSRRGYIKKRSGGWDVVNPSLGYFKLKACIYTLGKKLKREIKFLAKTLSMNDQSIRRLFVKFPSIHAMFFGFVLVYNINLKDKIINRINNECIEVKEEIIDAKNTVMNKIQERNSIKGKAEMVIDLRTCSQFLYQYLNEEQFKEAERYREGISIHHSIELYEQHLKDIGKSDKIIKPLTQDNKLTPRQIEIIKDIPENFKVELRELLRARPELKADFNWIFDWIIKRYMQEHFNNELRDLLKKYNFNYFHIDPSIKVVFNPPVLHQTTIVPGLPPHAPEFIENTGTQIDHYSNAARRLFGDELLEALTEKGKIVDEHQNYPTRKSHPQT